MRVLHTALLNKPEPGTLQQMLWEQEAAEALGLHWHARSFGATTPTSPWVGVHASAVQGGGNSSWARARRWIVWRRRYYEWLADTAKEYDLVLVRHSLHDPFRAHALACIAAPVATVHHTLEGPELHTMKGVGGSCRTTVEKVFGPRAIEQADVVVGVTQEIAIYEQGRVRTPKPTVVYPNGAVVTEHDRVAAGIDSRPTKPTLLFVASRFTAWQGLDRLLRTLPGCNEDFELNVVGIASPADRALGDRRVHFLGPLDADAIRQLARRSWLGLSSLALDRKGMREACPLKVREYLKAGLPVYGSYEETFPADATFYRSGPAKIDKILQFAYEMREVSPAATLEAATPYIDKRQLLAKCMTDLAAAIG